MGRKPKVKTEPPAQETLNNLNAGNPYPDSALDSASSIDSGDDGGHVGASMDIAGGSADQKKRGRKPKKLKNKRPKDMPTRPLSAYNYFFRAERINWLEEKPDVLDKTKVHAPEPDGRKVKSRLFESMAKEVARRWKELEQSRRQRFLDQAAVDMKRYRAEIEKYQQQKVLEAGGRKAKKVKKPVKVPKVKLSTTGPKKPPAPLVPGQKRRGRPPKRLALEKAAAAAALGQGGVAGGAVTGKTPAAGQAAGGREPSLSGINKDKASMMSSMQQQQLQQQQPMGGGNNMHYGNPGMGGGSGGGRNSGMNDDFGQYRNSHQMQGMGGLDQHQGMKSGGYDQDMMHQGRQGSSLSGGHRGVGGMDTGSRSKVSQGQGGMQLQGNNVGGQGFDFAGLSDDQLRTLLEQQGQGGGGRGQGGLSNFDSLVGRSPTSSGLVGSFGGGQSAGLQDLMSRQLLQQQYQQQMMQSQLPIEQNLRMSGGMGGFGNSHSLEQPHLQQLFGLQSQGYGSSGSGFGGMNAGFGDHSDRGTSSGSRRPSVSMTGGPGSDDGGGGMNNNYQLLQLLAAQQQQHGGGGGGYGGGYSDSLQNANY
jgi:hypothetical protein